MISRICRYFSARGFNVGILDCLSTIKTGKIAVYTNKDINFIIAMGQRKSIRKVKTLSVLNYNKFAMELF